jgi:hypothetical protein
VTVPEGTTPWLDDDAAPPELRTLVASGRGDGPSSAELERLAGRLAPLVGVTAAALVVSGPAPALAVAPASPAPLAGGALGKAAAVKLAWSGALKIIGAACVVGAGYFALAPAHHEPASQRQVTQALPGVAVDALPAPVVAAPVVAAPVVAPASEVVPLARSRGAKAQVTVPGELELIQEAQAAAEPARALAVLRTHERHYPGGMLAQERDVLVIRALLALDRRADAEARAARMAERYPGSAHLRRVRVLLDEPAGK